MDFVAIDVETANADMASICQIGLARFKDGRLVDEWSSLVDPEDYFDYFNSAIHGITEKSVKGAPTFPDVAGTLSGFLSNTVCVSHTHFDRISVGRALKKYSLGEIETVWLDSAKVARRTWKEFAWNGGYGLSNVCRAIGYTFHHHDALEDAKASGQILIAAIEKTGFTVEAWLKRVRSKV
jgi:DNA polymerase-3 subunit epsilon